MSKLQRGQALRILQLDEDFDLDELKLRKAYLQALLRCHPDKQSEVTHSIDQIREAFAALQSNSADYEVHECSETYHELVDLSMFDYNEEKTEWFLPCRCGSLGGFRCTNSDLEQGYSILGCSNCSIIIKVDYEMIEE